MLLYIAPSESIVPVLSPCPVGRSAKEKGEVYRITAAPCTLKKKISGFNGGKDEDYPAGIKWSGDSGVGRIKDYRSCFQVRFICTVWGIMLLPCMCLWYQGGREGGRVLGYEQAHSLCNLWFACPVKGRWCRAMAEVSASLPVKLRLSFTTGCSRTSFQTPIHPLLLCLPLPSHSLALKYVPWHQDGLFTITQPGDSGGPAVNALAILWCDILICIQPPMVYAYMYMRNKSFSRTERRAGNHLLSLLSFLKHCWKQQGTHLLGQSYSGHWVPRSCC